MGPEMLSQGKPSTHWKVYEQAKQSSKYYFLIELPEQTTRTDGIHGMLSL